MHVISLNPVSKLYKRALVTWLVFIPVAILNGSVREFVFKRFTGDLTAHQLSVLTGAVAFFITGYLLLGKAVILATNRALATIGCTWMFLSIVFEFAMGYFIRHLSWHDMLQDYHIAEGRLWPLILVTLAITPWLSKRIRSAGAHPDSLAPVHGNP